MKIACIGWGSLIWDPNGLPIQGEWFENGPLLPIEFARQSNNNRLTLTITPNTKELNTLWALMSVENLPSAIEALRVREGILLQNIQNHIGRVEVNEITTDVIEQKIQIWLKSSNLDAAIWTKLPPKFNNEERPPTIEEAILFINNLDTVSNNRAIDYINNAPNQIKTAFRDLFAEKLIRKS